MIEENKIEVPNDELVFTTEEIKEIKPIPKLTLIPEFHPLLKEAMPEYDWSHPYDERKAFTKAMIDTMRGIGGVGLSACQVGYKVRMFVMDRIDILEQKRTETLALVARTPALLVRSLVLGAVRVRVMLVSDIVEELDLVAGYKQRRSDGVYGCVAPALVVEAALGVKVLEEGGVGGATPELHIGDLKVAPDCFARGWARQ